MVTAAKPVIPKQPKQRVTDTAGFMSEPARKALDQRLVDWQANTGHELGVYIAKTTAGVPRSYWCQVAFNSWGVGQKGKDDGIVLFIFANEGRPGRGGWQITLGYGMERHISDAEATRIVREVPVAGLDAGDRDRAVVDTVNAIIAEIKE